MSFRRRTYPEVLDELLTALVGGVPGEAHPFPPPGAGEGPTVHRLTQPPARQVVAVHGARGGEPHRFRESADWALSDDGTAVSWLDGAELPDRGTLLHITYVPAAASAALDDLHVGSVTRTLTEAAAMEIARLEAQLQSVYDAGFLGTATGRSLDNVVALLGVERDRAGNPTGDVEFRRSAGDLGTITIPAGTRVMTADGAVEYATVATVTLVAGQQRIRVAARDLERGNEGVPADALTVLPTPILGIASVTNPAPTTASGRDEDDEELRTRARSFLHGSERATLGALAQAVRRQGLTADVVEDPHRPGHVTVTPHAAELPPELLQRVDQAIQDARPAGVEVELLGAVPPRLVDLELRLQTASGLLIEDLQAAQRAVRDAVAEEFARLPVRETASLNRLVSLSLAIPGVEDVRIVSATWTASDGGDPEDVLDRDAGVLTIDGAPTRLGALHIADPNLPMRLGVVVTYPPVDDPPAVPALRDALERAVAGLNVRNASEPPVPDPQPELRQLGFERLRSLLPLPDQAGASLTELDDGTVPATDGGGSPYRVRFLLTLETGLTHVLAAAGDAVPLTPFERLTLDAVEIAEEVGGG
jgi:hypothetical protein